MLLEVTAFDKAFLRGVEDREKGGGDTGDDGLGQNPVVRIGHRDRASVRGEKSAFFGNKKKETVIEALGGEATSTEILQDQV